VNDIIKKAPSDSLTLSFQSIFQIIIPVSGSSKRNRSNRCCDGG